VHDRDAVAEPFGLIEVVSGQHGGHAGAAAQAADQVQQLEVASPVIVDRATALPAFPRYERLALRAIRINEFVWLHDAPASPRSRLTSPHQ